MPRLRLPLYVKWCATLARGRRRQLLSCYVGLTVLLFIPFFLTLFPSPNAPNVFTSAAVKIMPNGNGALSDTQIAYSQLEAVLASISARQDTVTAIAVKPTPKSVTNNIAILVIDDDAGSASNFINQARSNFRLNSTIISPAKNTSIQRTATYYLFTANGNQNGLPGDVVMVDLAQLPQKTRLNPCKVYVHFAQQFGYFLAEKFDYVLSFDGRMKVVMPIDLPEEVLELRVGVAHPSFHAFYTPQYFPYYRRDDSACAQVAMGLEGERYYAGNLFGGETLEVAKLCQLISSCHTFRSNQTTTSIGNDDDEEADEEPQFHQLINRYFIDNRPTRVLTPAYCAATSISDLPFYPQKILLADKIVKQPLPPMGDDRFFAKREKRVQRLIDQIQRTFFSDKARQMSSKNKFFKLQFLAYRCDTSGGCGEFGDRIRGIAGLLYLAIISSRVYDVQWIEPADAGEFLAFNEGWYNVTAEQRETELLRSSYRPLYVQGAGDRTAYFLSKLNMWQFNEMSRKADVLYITTDAGKSLLQQIFRVPTFYPALHRVLPDLPEYKSNVDYAVYLSASLRLTLGSKKQVLKKMLNQTVAKVIGHAKDWSKIAKIGLYLKRCQNEQQQPPGCVSTDQQFKCFADKVLEIISSKFANSTEIVIFVSSDPQPEQAVDSLRPAFAHLKSRLTFMTSQNSTYGVGGENRDGAWLQMAATFVDWYLLTEMDWLLLSKGSYGETASMYSLKPTYQYEGFLGQTCQFSWFNADLSQSDGI